MVRECQEKGLQTIVLLVLNNCSAHYHGSDLQSDDGLFQVIFLPPNVTSECQPKNQAAICAINRRYTRKVMLNLVLEDEHSSFEQRLKNMSLKMCLYWLTASWEAISKSTIRNSWNKLIDEFSGFHHYECAGFTVDEEQVDSDDIKTPEDATGKLVGTQTNENEFIQ